MKHPKQILSVLMALVLCLALVPSGLAADDMSQEANLVFFVMGDAPKDEKVVEEAINAMLARMHAAYRQQAQIRKFRNGAGSETELDIAEDNACQKRNYQRSEPHEGFHVFIKGTDEHDDRDQYALNKCNLHIDFSPVLLMNRH